MCQIQFVMSNELANDCIANFTQLLEEGSQMNDDATGVFGERFTWKIGKAYEDFKKGKVSSLKEYMNEYGTNWLVGHNRLATQGSEKENANNHPFENDTCVVVHNGILNNDDSLAKLYSLEYKAETDSAIVPELVQMFIKDGEDEINAIKRTAELIGGSYSIFIMMKESKRLFYFKNSGTSFHLMRVTDDNDNVSVYGSTSRRQLEDIGYIKTNGLFEDDLYKRRSFGKPQSGTIYEIVYKGDMAVSEVDTFEPMVSQSKNWGSSWGNTSKWNYTGGAYYGDDGAGYSYSSFDELDDGVILDEDMEEAFEDCIREINYMESADDRTDVIGTLSGKIIDYHDKSQNLTVRNVPKDVGTLISSHLNAKEWYSTDTNMECANYTVQYKEIRGMITDGLIYKTQGGE